MFIQTEDTPNPNAKKFIFEFQISAIPRSYNDKDGCKDSMLATKLLNVKGIKLIFFGKSFITLSKNTDASWEQIQPELIMIMTDHFNSGLLALDNIKQNATKKNELTEIERQIVEILETKIRPAVAMDGGDIIFDNFTDGIVYLKLEGACSGCPSSSLTLKNGVEAMLKHYIPEIQSVEAIQ